MVSKRSIRAFFALVLITVPAVYGMEMSPSNPDFSDPTKVVATWDLDDVVFVRDKDKKDEAQKHLSASFWDPRFYAAGLYLAGKYLTVGTNSKEAEDTFVSWGASDATKFIQEHAKAKMIDPKVAAIIRALKKKVLHNMLHQTCGIPSMRTLKTRIRIKLQTMIYVNYLQKRNF